MIIYDESPTLRKTSRPKWSSGNRSASTRTPRQFEDGFIVDFDSSWT